MLAGLEQRTRIAEEAAKTYAEKDRAYDEAVAAHRAFNLYNETAAEAEKRRRAYQVRQAAKEAYILAEQKYIKAQELVRDVEESYMFGLVRAWDWLDLYMNQLVQRRQDDER